MSHRRYRLLTEQVKLCSPEAILRAASLCDGHSILAPKAFLDAGLPPDVVAHLTSTHESDGTPKSSIYVNGHAVEKLEGVYGLDALRFLASALCVEYRSAIGRGFEAANILHALEQHLQPTVPKPAA
ncbi:hypothetical protein [Humisphaera borealis]|uniref:Uncharacterized protein n=1 Tax=Humisphaera borealis TaxID=2807512 RepID=A0A7M2WX36_9BACT|nr:hypothetical protein [Humisphaera borealis]QOV89762.1 hypothetical protein IPV69_26865 [Humisphaera borealis]